MAVKTPFTSRALTFSRCRAQHRFRNASSPRCVGRCSITAVHNFRSLLTESVGNPDRLQDERPGQAIRQGQSKVAKNERSKPMKIYDFLQVSSAFFPSLRLDSGGSQQPPGWRHWPQKPTRAGTFPQALMSQSRWNAAGAVCAGTAAFSQSIAVLLPYVGLN
jgi:hypothetical protein